MNWKELFDEERLNRGYTYYIEDRVYDVILTDNTITSKVEGSRSKTYEVKIVFNQNQIESLYCTCPYCFSDFNCKHMVATLYKMEEINNNTKDNILDKNYDEQKIFTDLISNVDENKLRRYIYDKFKMDKKFMEDFINEFQNNFTPEDFDNYENMLENIFNIDVVELYNENGFYQEAPFHKYLENFINDKIRLLYKNKEYDYVLQLLYIIYENISEKVDVTQYIEIDNILATCNYYIEKIIEVQEKDENEEIFNYLINKISYDYNSKTTKYLINIIFNKFNTKFYLNQLDSILNDIITENNNVPEDILLSKYKLMILLNYPSENQYRFLEEYKYNSRIMNILIKEEIINKNYEKAINLLNENKEIHGQTFSLETSIQLLSLYKLTNNNEKSKNELKLIIYDYNIKDMFFIKELKKLLTFDEWDTEKKKLIEFLEDNYSYDFLNEFYIVEHDYDNLFKNLITNCQIQKIEEYRDYIEEKYNDEIINIYYNYIFEESKKSKNISGYTIIINYLDLMISYPNSNEKVKKIISILKNKYSQRKLFMEKLEEFEILNSLN